jgi:hypothetical protein
MNLRYKEKTGNLGFGINSNIDHYISYKSYYSFKIVRPNIRLINGYISVLLFKLNFYMYKERKEISNHPLGIKIT